MQILMSVCWVYIYVTVMLYVTTQMETITALANLVFLAMAHSVKVCKNEQSTLVITFINTMHQGAVCNLASLT